MRSLPYAPTSAVLFVTGVLSRQTSFLVYCEQEGNYLCANGLHAAAVVRGLQYFFCSMRSPPFALAAGTEAWLNAAKPLRAAHERDRAPFGQKQTPRGGGLHPPSFWTELR